MNHRKYIGTLLFAALACGGASAQQPQPSGAEQVVYINGTKYRIHAVAKGETLYSLSKLYGVSIDDLVAENPALKDGLKTGQTLKIPTSAERVATTAPAKSEKRKKGKFLTHTVAKGETLYSVARKYSVTVETLIADNDNLDPAHVAVGQTLYVRKGKAAKVEATEPPKERPKEASGTEQQQAQQSGTTIFGDEYGYHVVHAGETAASIAERFGTSEQALLALNGMRRASEMKTGLIVKVPREQAVQPQEPTAPSEQPQPQAVEFKTLQEGEVARVALLLPLHANGASAQNYMDFYRGFLLGMDAVRMQGIAAEVNLFDTAHEYARVEKLVSDGSLDGADLIVGPIYEDLMAPVVEFAEQHSVPVVSPLANMAEVKSGAVFQMSPEVETKYDKVGDLLDGSKRVVLIRSGATDKEFEREVLQALGATAYTTHEYVYEHPSAIERRQRDCERTGATYVPGASDISPLLQGDGERVFVVLSESETDVDRVLAALASANISLTARSRSVAPFTVLGNNRWNKYKNIDRSIFFTDNVVMLSTYHVLRGEARVRKFDGRYVEAFGSIPTLYAYRGYDAAAVFVQSLYGSMRNALEGERFMPLQTPYRFEAAGDGAVRMNREWVRVNYHSNFTTTMQ